MSAKRDPADEGDTGAAKPADLASALEAIQSTTFCGVIPAAEAKQFAQKWGMTIPQLMYALVGAAALLAQPVISGFKVGAVTLGQTTGNLYFGANMEFSGQALTFTAHAEQSAITNAWLNGEQGVTLLAVSAAPCGYCRQFLYELDTAAQLGVTLDGNTIMPLTDLLPLPFGPGDLGVTSALMAPAQNGLQITPPPTDALVIAALGAANTSYAPYSKGYAGIAVQTSTGTVYTGRYAENAAFNPSMSPLESALTMRGLCADADPIARAVLVEAQSPADQTGASALVLESVASGVQLEVVIAA